MQSLKEYPKAIEKAQIEQDDLWSEHFEAADDISALEVRYEDEASKDETLTNATKRKAYVQRCKEDDHAYNEAYIKSIECKRLANRKGFEIQRLQREYEIALVLEQNKVAP